jgi:YVTN family beta-propeller protein
VSGTALAALHPSCDGASLLDPSGLEVLATVPLDGEPLDIAVAGDRAVVMVAQPDHDAVSVIDLRTRAVVATSALGEGVTAVAIAPDTRHVYAGRSVGERVEIVVVDTTSHRQWTIDVGSAPGANIDALIVDPDGRTLYAGVTDDRASQVIILDVERGRVHRVVPIGAPLRDMAYAGGAVCVLTSDRTVGGVLHSVDLATTRVTDRVVVGGAPTRVAVSPDEARAYVVDYDRVVVVDTLTLEVVDALTVGARPAGVALHDGRLYVADYAGSVSVFTVGSAIASVYAEFLTAGIVAPVAPRIAYTAPRRRQPVAV